MAKETATPSTEEEHDVQEVRCSVTGMPIPAIPLWYADVKVNFVSDAARSKSSVALRTAELVEEEEDEEEEAEEGDISLEDVDEDIAADEVEMDLGDSPAEEASEA